MTEMISEKSPMGWFYAISGDKQPYVNRCKVGQQWERAEVYDLAEMTPDELSFVADLIDRHKQSRITADDLRLAHG
jgi:hypothetical protein